MRVQILQSINDLYGIALDLKFMQSLSALKQLVHALILTQFKQNIDVLSIFKEVLELTNVDVLDRSVYLDLTHQLLLGTALR